MYVHVSSKVENVEFNYFSILSAVLRYPRGNGLVAAVRFLNRQKPEPCVCVGSVLADNKQRCGAAGMR